MSTIQKHYTKNQDPEWLFCTGAKFMVTKI